MKIPFKKFFTWENAAEIALVVIIIGGIVGYGEYRRFQLTQEITAENAAQKQTDVTLSNQLSLVQKMLSDIQNQNTNLNGAVQNVQNQTALYTQQVGEVSSTAATLDKLSKVDPELLEKYSKVFFLNENYTPSSLTAIDSQYLYSKGSKLQFLSDAEPFLENLLNAAKSAGLSLEVISAYRSFGTQAALKSEYKVTYGAGTANSFSADQGYSEHQLGTAVDFTTPSVGDTFAGFDATPEYAWLQSNAYKYGFVLSYPKNNSYYEYEPWHWRFVGVDLATRLHTEGKNFYDLDQRTINDYLATLFD